MKFSICYSPTGTSKKAVQFAANHQAELYDWTLPQDRGKCPNFSSADYLFCAFPVYAGRIPKLLLAPIKKLKGNGAKAIIIATYGNRHYDDAPLEMADLLTAQGFTIIGAAAIVAEHSYTEAVATAYPVAADLTALTDYCATKIKQSERLTNIPGNRPYRPYIERKAAPKPPQTSDQCIVCDACVRNCPVGAIEADCVTIANFCTMCCACIKICPVGAKSLADDNALAAKAWLEENCRKPIRPLEVFD